MSQTITVQNVDIDMLRIQRNTLLGVIDRISDAARPSHNDKKMIADNLGGLVELLDTMLDIAEGFPLHESAGGGS